MISYWRCDSCGETFTVQMEPVLLDGETKEVIGPAPPGVDFVLDGLPCSICGERMRRVVSAGDLRDWGAQVTSAIIAVHSGGCATDPDDRYGCRCEPPRRCACGRELDAQGEHDGGYGAHCG
jgi:hypothetical protein